ncbi:MAG: chloramphenicol phosphotransferase CPT family protein [Pseudomonadales bacterium]|nr:chloramphenicol phosphotransferase CPT family protein [Pseudomonadales bacterium]
MFEGSIILLNGASSSGKTSIVAPLQRLMPEPFVHVSVDRNHESFPHHCWDFNSIESSEIDRFISGYHACVATLALYGNRVIFDTVLCSTFDRDECSLLFTNCKPFYIHITCSLPELENRERLRHDREQGLAASQVRLIANCGPFDLEVDTTSDSPYKCAEKIAAFISSCSLSRNYSSRLLTKQINNDTNIDSAKRPPSRPI